MGWFFVPIANLWKPFEGIKEVWQAGVDPAEWPRVETPELLRGWWGCWIAGNIASNSNLSALVIKYVGAEVALAIDLAASALLIAAAALLIRIVAELSDRQLIARAAHALA